MLIGYTVFTLSFFFLKKFISGKYYSTVAAIFLFCQVISMLFLLGDIVFSLRTCHFNLKDFFTNEFLVNFSPSFSLNYLSYCFVLLVSVIGFTTNIYILNYFRGEADESGFIFWINAFIVSMLLLVLSANFFTLFLGWELIGLTSFFLINFWQAKRSTLKSSFKAFSFNLISDVFLLIAFVCFYYSTGTTECDVFHALLILDASKMTSGVWVGAFSLVLCAAIKSVQIFGHLWLPDSMEAPVPASSLIHSATLVSAGIYLISKFHILFIILDWISGLLFLGAFTAAYGAIVASAQTDLKKLLAYSTMSHCGFLWILASMGAFGVMVLYLFLHGLFKASTFYCAGSFIRAYGTQDSRWMGDGATYYRGDTLLYILSALNLAGLPFSIGFFYKTFFFKMLLLTNLNYINLGLMIIGMLGSVVYFFRLVYYVCFDFLKTVKNLSIKSILATLTNFQPYTITSLNHIIAVSMLLLFSLVVVYFFFWFLLTNPLDFSSQPGNPEILIFSLSLEKVYVAYLIFFYFIYLILILVLLLSFYRSNSYSFQVMCSVGLIFLILFFIF